MTKSNRGVFLIFLTFRSVCSYANPHCIGEFSGLGERHKVISIFSRERKPREVHLSQGEKGADVVELNSNRRTSRKEDVAVAEARSAREQSEMAHLPMQETEKHRQAADNLIAFLKWLEKLNTNPNSLENLSQSQVWTTHSNFIKAKEMLRYWRSHSELPDAVLTEMHNAVERIEKSGLFNSIVDHGFTLVPRANQMIKEPLPNELVGRIDEVKFFLGFLETDIKLTRSMGSDLLARLFTADSLRRGVTTLSVGFLSNLNQVLGDVRMTVGNRGSLKKYDLENLQKLVESTDKLIQSRAFSEFQEKNSKSFFRSTRDQATIVKKEINRFKLLKSEIFETSDKKFSLVTGAGGPEVTGGERLTMESLNRFQSEMLDGLSEHGFGVLPIWLEMIGNLTSDLRRIQGPVRDAAMVEELRKISQMGWMVVDSIPEKTFLGLGHSAFSREDIRVARRLRKELGRIDQMIVSAE